jgi:hypothetical protein
MKPDDIHAIIVLAEQIAVKQVKAELRAKGGKISLAPGATLKAMSNELLRLRPEIYAEAKARWGR